MGEKKILDEIASSSEYNSITSYTHASATSKDSREKGSHEKIRIALFHEYPPDTLESTNDQRGKEDGNTLFLLVKLSFNGLFHLLLDKINTDFAIPPHIFKKQTLGIKQKCQ